MFSLIALSLESPGDGCWAKAPSEGVWAAAGVIMGTKPAKHCRGSADTALPRSEAKQVAHGPPKSSPQRQTPDSCISLHQLMGNTSLEVEGKEFALMLLRLMRCKTGRAIPTHPRATRATEYLILISYCPFKGKSRVFNRKKKKRIFKGFLHYVG